MTNANETRSTITISVDGTWAGDGKLRAGVIEDCGAQFADDTDASEAVYEQIEEAIASGQSRIKVEIDGETCVIEWSISDLTSEYLYEVESHGGAVSVATEAQVAAIEAQDLCFSAAMDLAEGVEFAKVRTPIEPGIAKAYRTKR